MTSNREKVEAVSIEILFASADVTKTGFCCLFLFRRNEIKLRSDLIQIQIRFPLIIII